MMNAHTVRTHATQMQIVSTLLVHTAAGAELVSVEMVTRAQVKTCATSLGLIERVRNVSNFFVKVHHYGQKQKSCRTLV